jgi:hypothetical protein
MNFLTIRERPASKPHHCTISEQLVLSPIEAKPAEPDLIATHRLGPSGRRFRKFQFLNQRA